MVAIIRLKLQDPGGEGVTTVIGFDISTCTNKNTHVMKKV